MRVFKRLFTTQQCKIINNNCPKTHDLTLCTCTNIDNKINCKNQFFVTYNIQNGGLTDGEHTLKLGKLNIATIDDPFYFADKNNVHKFSSDNCISKIYFPYDQLHSFNIFGRKIMEISERYDNIFSTNMFIMDSILYGLSNLRTYKELQIGLHFNKLDDDVIANMNADQLKHYNLLPLSAYDFEKLVFYRQHDVIKYYVDCFGVNTFLNNVLSGHHYTCSVGKIINYLLVRGLVDNDILDKYFKRKVF